MSVPGFSPEVLEKLAQALYEAGYISSKQDMQREVREIAAQLAAGGHGKGSNFDPNAPSITRFIRGIAYSTNPAVNTFSSIPGRSTPSREEDIAYAQRTLLTGQTPGSYLVPTIQADQIIALLTSAQVIRKAGARIWPMKGIQKLNVPVATAAPTIVWGNSAGSGSGGQGVQLTPSDPNIGQLAFDLKSQKSLIAIPNELLAVSVPAIDQIVSQLLVDGFAQDEINSFLATATGTGKPTTLYAASGTTAINAHGGSANGGTVTYTDLLGVVGTYYANKGKGAPAWFMHPTVFYKDVMGILDSNNRPIVTGQDNVEQAFMGKLLGFPVYVSAEFPTNQAVGSGSNQSYIAFTNPQYLHIADEGALELAVSFERFFDSNETAIRGVHRVDFGFAPAAAIVLLEGVNV